MNRDTFIVTWIRSLPHATRSLIYKKKVEMGGRIFGY